MLCAGFFGATILPCQFLFLVRLRNGAHRFGALMVIEKRHAVFPRPPIFASARHAPPLVCSVFGFYYIAV
jgi:hypothetical protein